MPFTPENGSQSGSSRGHLSPSSSSEPQHSTIRDMFVASMNSVTSDTLVPTPYDPFFSSQNGPLEEGGAVGEYDYEEDSAASGAVGGVEDEKCGEHLRNVTAAHEAWEDCLRSMNADEGSSIAFLNLSSAMKHFHTAVADAIKDPSLSPSLLKGLEQEVNRVEEEMIQYNRNSTDKQQLELISKAIDLMFRHFVNKCSSGSTCAFTEGGDKELLRYGDLAMKKLFEQTKQMKNAMYEILQMVEKKVSLEYEYAKNLYKMGMEQTIVMDKMSQTFPFLDILQNLSANEKDFAVNLQGTCEKLMRKEFVDPLKARIQDFEEVTNELRREWQRKQAYYDKAKENSKETYNKYYSASLAYEKEVGRIPAAERARIAEKEGAKNRAWTEYRIARDEQKKAWSELCSKRQWVLTSTLNVVWQAERKLQSALGHLFRNFTTGLQQRPLIYKYLLSETVAKTLAHNENIVYDILYQDAEIEGSTKDQEQEFESKEHPYEKDIAAAVADARSTKPPRDGSIFSGIFSGKTQHTWEKMVPDDTTHSSKCFECHEYVYEGSLCTKCGYVMHSEHKEFPLKYPHCDQLKDYPPPPLRYFRRAVADQPLNEAGEPLFLSHFLAIVEDRFIKDIGIYRQEGVRKKAAQLCEKIERDIYSVTADDISDHKVIGMVIKHYIRTIPKSLLEEKLFDSWMTLGADIVKSNSEGTKVPPHVLPGVIYNLQSIAPANRRAARVLIIHLKKIAAYAQFNNMNSHNLGIVFGPNIIRKTKTESAAPVAPQHMVSARDSRDHTDLLKTVMVFMIDNYEQVFESEALSSSFSKSTTSSFSSGHVSNEPSSQRASQLSHGSDGQYVELDPLQAMAIKRGSEFSTDIHSASSTEHFPPIDDSPSTSRSRTPAPAVAHSDANLTGPTSTRTRNYDTHYPLQSVGNMSKTSSNYELR